MKKFLKELIENFPEIEKNKEVIEKVVYYLNDNKPVFNASNDFKNKLKSRINGVISLKINKKNNFLIFAIPVFSFVFVVAGFFYYFKDITFFNGKNPNKNLEIVDIKTYNNDENIVLDDNLDDSILEKENLELNKDEDIKINSNHISTTKNSKTGNNNTTVIKKSNEIVDVKDESNTQVASDLSVENNEISNLLDAVGETYDYGISGSSEFENSIDSTGIGASPMMDLSSSRLFKSEAVYDTFEVFCKNNLGVIYEAGNEQICRVNKKECLSSNYINGTCEFKEIK
ncbi:MAG: hypothetical protein PHH98_03895 [Candidatus Gracilibacteria bacterium]|nr:hypothetical protein [Candidatus Gracilibacteria bacterium]